ncbi:MAG: SphA family protein, partial [Hyphomicrobiaceae bacterium]
FQGGASGNAAAGVTLDQLGAEIDIDADLDLDASFAFALGYGLWVAPRKVLGGNIGFGVILPIGWQDVSADIDVTANLELPNGETFTASQTFMIGDHTRSVGDPVLVTTIGWQRGNWRWRLAGLLNVPVGSYKEERITNMGFNRWAFDAHLATTWLDPTIGLEISTTTGFTFNGENPDTNYKTGTEFHFEYAAIQNFSKRFGLGVVGVYYEQITDDSGAGANLGGFRGRTVAIGPNINYNFQLNGVPISSSLRWYHELEVNNRLKGDIVIFNATAPLGGPRR